MAKTQGQDGISIVAKNRRARHDYELLELFEAGMVLTGTEIKSVRAHRVSLQRSFVQERGNELFLVEANIAQYEHGNRENHEPTRSRKLLLHRRQINRLITAVQQKGLTLIPTRMYLKNGCAKLEFALARGKHKYDKRQDVAKRDDQRRVERALREKYR
ncbi:MAG: SsrA-binding protein SmpB [Ardenticatenaceae bacterium]|nr:SsrA-binding protein SmpB [Anaerolineales bacterium]MCB8922011.1 SsrA-binding protein SmpB [Ardenticatenaceae bacterium]MCB8989587.1 SsrA-binding protein SmpB [Ardenticatenaceae bacterium]MCB9003130.1 SsrA-binding protein SmpB [Ardenticatenaceae bacterium]